MAEPYNYLGLMGGTGSISSIPETVQNAILGRQQVQNNQSVLDAQAREDAARKAMANIVLAGQDGRTAGAPGPSQGGSIVATPEQEAQTRALEAQYGKQPSAAAGQTPDQVFAQAIRTIADADPARAQAILRQRQMQQDMRTVLSNPTAQNIGRFGMIYPEALKDLKAGWDMMDAGQKEAATRAFADTFGYLQSGDVDGAVKSWQAHIDADQKAGNDTTHEQAFLETLRSNPNAATAVAGLNLSLGMGHDKFADTYGKLGEEQRASEMQPAKVAEARAQAQIKGVEAQYAPAKAQSDLQTADATRQRMAVQNATDRANVAVAQGRLALDQQTLATNTELKMAELDQKGAELPESVQKLRNDAAGDAAEKQMIAQRERDLAARISNSGMHSGPTATASEAYKRFWGTQNEYSQLRAEYAQLRNSGALANRANMPGAMSDADREFLLQGFPPPNADPAYIARFLNTMAQAHEAQGRQADTKSIWITENGGLGPARRDFVLDGYRVPKGMTFAQQQTAMAKLTPPATPPEAEAVVRRARGR